VVNNDFEIESLETPDFTFRKSPPPVPNDDVFIIHGVFDAGQFQINEIREAFTDTIAHPSTENVERLSQLATQLRGRANELRSRYQRINTRDGISVDYNTLRSLINTSWQHSGRALGELDSPPLSDGVEVINAIFMDTIDDRPVSSGALLDMALEIPYELESVFQAENPIERLFGLASYNIQRDHGAQIFEDTSRIMNGRFTLSSWDESAERDKFDTKYRGEYLTPTTRGFYAEAAHQATLRHFGMNWDSIWQNQTNALKVRDLSLWVGAAFERYKSLDEMQGNLNKKDAMANSILKHVQALVPQVSRFSSQPPILQADGMDFLRKIGNTKL